MTARQRYSYAICFCAALLFLGLSTSFLAPLVTHITGNLGITLSLFSALVILKSLTFSAGSFLLGRIRQRISANRLIAMGLFLLPLLSFIYPRTHSVPLFVAALLIWGISGALIEGGADNRNSELPEERVMELRLSISAAPVRRAKLRLSIRIQKIEGGVVKL